MDSKYSEVITKFEDGCLYEVELSSGYTKGVYRERLGGFHVEMPDGSVRLLEPAFLDPTSELVVWKKLD